MHGHSSHKLINDCASDTTGYGQHDEDRSMRTRATVLFRGTVSVSTPGVLVVHEAGQRRSTNALPVDHYRYGEGAHFEPSQSTRSDTVKVQQCP